MADSYSARPGLSGGLIFASRPVPPSATAPLPIEQLIPLSDRAEPTPIEHAYWCCQRARQEFERGNHVGATGALIAAQAFIRVAADEEAARG